VSAVADRIAAAVEARDEDAVHALVREEPGAADGADGQGRSLLLLALFHGLHGAAGEIAAARTQPPDALEAAATGDAARLRELLAADRDAVLAARTWEGFDAIGLAAFLGGAEAVGVLLEHGADPDGDPANPFGVRPVHAAAAHRDAAAMRLLLDAGADANATQQGGATPLDAARHHGDEEIVRLLLDHGADAQPRTG
jgi:ankyrin repeat protein